MHHRTREFRGIFFFLILRQKVTHSLCSISPRQTSKATHKLAPWRIPARSGRPKKKKRERCSLAKSVIALVLCDETLHTLFTPELHQMHGVFFFRHTFVNHRTFFLHLVASTLIMWACLLDYTYTVVPTSTPVAHCDTAKINPLSVSNNIYSCSFWRLKLAHKKKLLLVALLCGSWSSFIWHLKYVLLGTYYI